jgi:geranylgeranyl diphosphate synthase type II
MSYSDEACSSVFDGHNGSIGSVPPERRMLLLPHCLRPAQGCPGTMTREGLICGDCDNPSCAVRPLREAAEKAGYLTVCVAPGGRLAVRRVAETHPEAIVAVACAKELAEGVAAVQALGWNGSTPPIVQIPLLQDGCVNTEVDVAAAIALIES